ncbi:MAG: division/outer membrane stress-associated lipid-binding lipoprotein [Gammaproteobacteria bacterium]|nr:MAG: division/outer membrane stress-associated lipid-binding lipoprotein [Gammaproteobacteria bacterium]
MNLRLRIFLIALLSLTMIQGCAPLIIAGGATAAAAARDRRTVGAFVDDGAIELKTGRAIRMDPMLKGKVHINVTSMNGIVLLSGEAPTSSLRDLVLKQARTVQGIRRIVNEVRISPPTSLGSRSKDTWLTTKVKGKMVSTKNLDATRVKVVTENKVVYLMGLVKRREGELATEAARSVKGVQRVVKLFEYID